MKGIVFTEFLEMVEDKFSMTVADNIIENANLQSKGAYTAVGTYDYHEMFSLVQELSKSTGVPIPDLLRVYGEHLFGRFAAYYANFFTHVTDAFTFLESIHGHIHKEVLKLYPDAELPTFEAKRLGDDGLTMHYKSERRMGDFAYGLMIGCLKYFKEEATVEMELLDDQGSDVLFTLKKV